MKKGLVIAVSGQVGAGKTTYAKKLAETFGLRYASSGGLFRKLAEDLGVSLIKLHEMAETDPKYDLMVDKRARKLAEEGNIVIEGHLAAWVLQDIADILILLKAPLEVRAKRLAERDGKTVDKALEEIKLREESNRRRCLKYYGKNMDDWTIFDIIIDTSKLDINQIFNVLKTFVEAYISKQR